jgi:hypothetical protein
LLTQKKLKSLKLEAIHPFKNMARSVHDDKIVAQDPTRTTIPAAARETSSSEDELSEADKALAALGYAPVSLSRQSAARTAVEGEVLSF